MLLDFSLGLVNRTGAYFVGRDIQTDLGDLFEGVRYWRVGAKRPPAGAAKRVLAKAMLAEIGARAQLGLAPKPARSAPTLFLDPLYVLIGGVRRDDVVLCHDVGPISHPELFESSAAYRQAYRLIAEAGPGMVFVSRHSRDEFVRLYGDGFRFLRVIPLYVRDGVDQRAAPGKPSLVSGPFLLCVGAVGARKNQKRLIEAFGRSGLAAAGISLVVVGAREHGYQAVAAAAADTPGVVLRGYVGEAELSRLYRDAEAFCLPSLVEGFGMPALEAVSRGLVAAVSQGGALEETVASKAILVDPLDVDSIAAGLEAALALSAEARAKLVAQAKAQADALSRARFITEWRALIAAETAGRTVETEAGPVVAAAE